MKKLIFYILLICLLLPGLFSCAAPQVEEQNNKISGELSSGIDALSDTDKITVYVLLYDADDDEILEAFSERYPRRI